MMARIGIFGGSFNPPHLGHLLALREFQEKLNLDELLVIPAGDPPHKALSANSPDAELRFVLTELACVDIPKCCVSDMELRREGKSYTADTVLALRGRYPADELFLLMGTDMFLSFEKWYSPEVIAKEATLVVAHRAEDDRSALEEQARRLRERFGAKVVWLENAFLPYSSTSVRAMLTFGCGKDYLAPMVYEEICQRRLYYVGHDLKNLPFEELSRVSLSLHNPKRVPHAQGCSRTAETLAERFGADPDAALRAGILHDVTKALLPQEQLKLCEECGMLYSDFEGKNGKLLHAKTGAAVAARVFGESREVCEAIRWHTTGRANMTTLEKIIYLADYMEPNRDFPGVEKLREAAETSLDAAMILGLEMSIAQLRGRGRSIDPNSQAALDFFQERTKEK